MGRPRGKAKKSAEDARDDDDGSGGEEAAPTDHKRSGSPLKPLRDDGGDEEVEDIAKVAEVADSVKLVVPTEGADSTVEGKVPDGAMKRPRRRRRRLQVKRSSESVEDVGEKDGDDVRTKSNGFRRNGSRRKNSTPRRAAEAGVVSVCDRWV
ncbi:hypothetical protein CFC21_108887 [Triticum aestivum]|uniref:Uncharacterized protein n=3 Tax=Triticinae TaxID=1648030 RepID=A0A453RJV8_AEGTS|nr:uncharacterized protein LOC109731688 [Aegilops tauschii subsp. strangulata]XP_044441181.1 uncharacterized protein LOC123167410 [Triticum aestivum]KAF7108400.1 hypothetical protein CFC21_108887 [Triticum aestivum]